ncbi:hypothetical protein [Pandoraea communis]|uniref:hypothetical protein n=1 Tax=Pandoraea communis TaxID=2508297 RepID=UPI0025A675C4|nr:hypothetical protein [Pandoraea communis]MDM8356660.1 hypothetical protein [Pandoraea communis]
MQGMHTQADALGFGILRQGADEGGRSEHAAVQPLRGQQCAPMKRDLHAFCEDWSAWHRSRRLFAPPVPANILARLVPRKVGVEPDAICSSSLSFFNLAVLALPESIEKKTFYLYYIHRVKNIKAVASEMGVSRDAFYKRVDSFRDQAYRAYRRMTESA